MDSLEIQDEERSDPTGPVYGHVPHGLVTHAEEEPETPPEKLADYDGNGGGGLLPGRSKDQTRRRRPLGHVVRVEKRPLNAFGEPRFRSLSSGESQTEARR
jgi:hypothetical protein